nr:BMA-TWK-2 [Brugia malayi]
MRPSELYLDTYDSMELTSTTSEVPSEPNVQQIDISEVPSQSNIQQIAISQVPSQSNIQQTAISEPNIQQLVIPEVPSEQNVIYYQNIPIHSLHQQTVETENALQNLLNAPESIISHELPPAVVDDNYCFVIDGETIGSEAMLHDDIHWSHTSRPTQYFYSDDLRHFQRVNCIKAKGKIIAVKIIGSKAQTFNSIHSIRSTIPIHQSHSVDSISTRSSITSAFRHDNIPLVQVYVVTRIYSFWKTCPSFRRIVTLLDKVNETEIKNTHFHKRIFVQHIWRNTKQSDKERVKCEFNRDLARIARSKISNNKKSTKFTYR